MEKDTIGIIPPGGYRSKEKYSMIAVKWLKWLSFKMNLDISHARNGGETPIKVNHKIYKVDGQDRDNRKSVYKFQGC